MQVFFKVYYAKYYATLPYYYATTKLKYDVLYDKFDQTCSLLDYFDYLSMHTTHSMIEVFQGCLDFNLWSCWNGKTNAHNECQAFQRLLPIVYYVILVLACLNIASLRQAVHSDKITMVFPLIESIGDLVLLLINLYPFSHYEFLLDVVTKIPLSSERCCDLRDDYRPDNMIKAMTTKNNFNWPVVSPWLYFLLYDISMVSGNHWNSSLSTPIIIFLQDINLMYILSLMRDRYLGICKPATYQGLIMEPKHHIWVTSLKVSRYLPMILSHFHTFQFSILPVLLIYIPIYVVYCISFYTPPPIDYYSSENLTIVELVAQHPWYFKAFYHLPVLDSMPRLAIYKYNDLRKTHDIFEHASAYIGLFAQTYISLFLVKKDFKL